jgi:hypothetical protein
MCVVKFMKDAGYVVAVVIYDRRFPHEEILSERALHAQEAQSERVA